MERYLDLVARYPKWILSLLVVMTMYFGYMSLFLTEDSNPYLLSEDHPARRSILEMRQEFTGTYDSLMIAVFNKEGIFNKQSIKALFELTEASKTLHLANEKDIARVEKLIEKYSDHSELVDVLQSTLTLNLKPRTASTIRNLLLNINQYDLDPLDIKYLRVLAERIDPIRELAGMAATENVFLEPDGTLRASITLDHPERSPEFVKQHIMHNELMHMGVIDEAGTIGLIVVEVSVLQDDSEGQRRAYEAAHQIVETYRQNNPDFTDEVFIGGVPVFFAEQKRIMDADMITLFPTVLVIVTLVLAAFFRSFIGVVIPLANVVMCTVWTFGMMSMVGIPLDIITAALPVFLITICSSDAIHVMADYLNQKNQGLHQSNKEMVRVTMRLMASPVILTTLTTCLTFSVSTLTSISNLRNFGICMAFGMFVAMIISLLMIPAWLNLLSEKNKKYFINTSNRSKEYKISDYLISWMRPALEHRKLSLLVTLIVVIGLGYVASLVRIDDMGSAYFKPDNSYRISDDFINENVAGTSPGWIEIDTGRPDGALSSEVVHFIDQLERFIHQQENITFSYSIARYVRRINYVLNDMNPEHNRLPMVREFFTEVDEITGESYTLDVSGDDIIRQAVLMYENGGGSDLTNVLNEDFSKTVLLYTMNSTVSSDYERFLTRLRPWLEDNIPQGMSYTLAGNPVIWTAVLNELLAGQKLSIFLAFACVMLVMSLWFRSIRMGFAGTLPLAVTVVCYYAIMTVLDIELNIGTAIISFLVLGVVDYSVHYLVRTKIGLEQGFGLDDSLKLAMRHSGRSIIINVIVFSAGFIALLFSEFKPIVDLGTLVGLSLLISGVMSIYLITLLAPWLIPHQVADNQPGHTKKTVTALGYSSN